MVRVVQQGHRLIHPDPAGVSIREIYGVNSDKSAPRAALERVLAVKALPDEWRAKLSSRLGA